MNLIGISWCKNEGDLLPYTLPSAIKQVDAMMIVDDDSDDNSWDVIKSFGNKLAYAARKRDLKVDSRQHLLEEVRKRYGTKDTWVQVIESDTIVMETDIKSKIEKYKVDDVSCTWNLLNACRKDWTEDWNSAPFFTAERAPWDALPYFHWMERMTYSFRPLEKLAYTERRTPWPQGFSYYASGKIRKSKNYDSPIAMHYGFRNPLFYYEKMKRIGRTKGGAKNPTWNFCTPAAVKQTVYLYNGIWNNTRDVFPGTRQGWCDWIDFRTEYLEAEQDG